RDDGDAARADLEAALQAKPDCLEAVVGLAELDAEEHDFSQLGALDHALAGVVRRSPGRGELYRRYARLADLGKELKLARSAWAEVVAEFPGDIEGEARLAALTRAAGDDAALEAQLLASLAREPRGA